ncbi:MAG TPA: hypothetical protein VM888_06015, partial [Chitinophagaceae bacterium]|nr:hypothetical protein [Chitinophagaceae bacterium]
SDDYTPSAIASKISSVTNDEINKKKLNAHKHAYKLSAETTYNKIREAVKELLNSDLVVVSKKSKNTLLSDKA